MPQRPANNTGSRAALAKTILRPRNLRHSKARSAQNALKHGLRAQKHIVLPSENAAEFEALEAALIEEVAPDGALQFALAQRIVSAVWRLSGAERLEADLFAHNQLAGRSLGLALIRDCNGGARSFDTLLRYRGCALAELWRALRTLKALQAERAASRAPAAVAPERLLPEPRGIPIEPEARKNPRDLDGPGERTDPPGDPGSPPAWPLPGPTAGELVAWDPPIERTGERIGSVPTLPSDSARRGAGAALLAGTALVPPGRRKSA